MVATCKLAISDIVGLHRYDWLEEWILGLDFGISNRYFLVGCFVHHFYS